MERIGMAGRPWRWQRSHWSASQSPAVMLQISGDQFQFRLSEQLRQIASKAIKIDVRRVPDNAT